MADHHPPVLVLWLRLSLEGESSNIEATITQPDGTSRVVLATCELSADVEPLVWQEGTAFCKTHPHGPVIATGLVKLIEQPGIFERALAGYVRFRIWPAPDHAVVQRLPGGRDAN